MNALSAAWALLSSRLGVALVLGLVIGGLLLDRAGLKSDVAERDATIAARDAQIAEYNAAVEKMRADGLAKSQAADARARDKLKPRPKPNTATVSDINQWLNSK